MKGGQIAEVIDGQNKGKFAQVPYMQNPTFARMHKVQVIYFEDMACELPTLPQRGLSITNISNLHFIGFYD